MKIKYQLCIFFLISSALLFLIASTVIYHYTKRQLLEDKFSLLESISETKKIRAEDLIQKKFETINVLKRIIQTNSKTTGENKVAPKDEGFIAPIKRYKNDLKSVKDLYLLDHDGTIQEAFDDSMVGRIYIPKDTTKLYPEYWRERKSSTPTVEDLSLNNKKELILTISLPVYSLDILIGIIIADIDGSDILSLANEYTALGETGETILAKKARNITVIAPTRFNQDTMLTLSLCHDNEKYVLYHSLNQEEGILLHHYDYRGEEVIASMRFIENIGWAMVTKMDTKEAMAAIVSLKHMLLIINGVTLIALAFVSFAAGNYFAKPIKKLTESANKIKEGDLSKRIDVRSKNEVGVLASTFNEMAERLEKKIHELKLSNESLNKFAYIITHDLKSPLISISSLTHILRNEYKNKTLDEEGIKILDMMILKSRSMEELIEGVLKSAKKGFKADEKEWINTNKLLEDIINNLNPPPHINIVIHGHLPRVHFNKVAFIQVFQNLISNAIKFINKPAGFIEIGGVILENKIRFFVRDNGRGIQESDYGKIFFMFGSTKTDENIESHGIGLSIVKKIITENNGEIWIESEIDKGTTFYFTIPTD